MLSYLHNYLLEVTAAAVADDSIRPQMTAMDDGTALHGDVEVEAYDSSDAQLGSPLHDFVALPDAEIKLFWGFFEPGTDEDVANWTPDWAQAPPKDIADETGETRGQVSLNDWVDEDEPVTDGTFSTPPDFEENAPTRALLGEVFDDDEPVADGSFGSPLEDAVAVTVDDVPPQELGQVYDDEEPVTDGWFSAPLQETPNDDILGCLLGEVYDDDEPVSDGWFSSPLEGVPVLNDEITGRTFPADDDLEDEYPQAFADGFVSSPLEDTPETVVQPGGYPWYYDEYGIRRRKKLIIPYLEPKATKEEKKEVAKAIAKAVLEDKKIEPWVPAPKLFIPGSVVFQIEDWNQSEGKRQTDLAVAEFQQRKLEKEIAEAEILTQQVIMDLTYEEAVRVLAEATKRRRELEKEEEQILLQFATEYF